MLSLVAEPDRSLTDNMLVPAYGEVGWYSSVEWQCIWKGSVSNDTYEILD